MKKPKFEGSKADEAEDRKNAKKRGVSLKAWEKSPGDKKADAAGQRALDRKKKLKKK